MSLNLLLIQVIKHLKLYKDEKTIILHFDLAAKLG